VTTLVVGVACFFAGGMCGLLVGAIAAAAARADERAAEAAMQERLSDRLVRDFHVVRDEDGTEHIVPAEVSPPTAAEDSPPPG